MPGWFSGTSKQGLRTWNLQLLFELWVFFLIMVLFQLIWEGNEEFLTTLPLLVTLSDLMGEFLLWFTPAILNPLLRLNLVREANSIVLPDGFYVSYWFYFSGIKQILLVTILFSLIRGPWLRKIWYIPLNIMLVLLFAISRFIILTIHSTIYPEHLHLLQDLLFGPLFYFEILVMWLIWVVYVAGTATLGMKRPSVKSEPQEAC